MRSHTTAGLALAAALYSAREWVRAGGPRNKLRDERRHAGQREALTGAKAELPGERRRPIQRTGFLLPVVRLSKVLTLSRTAP